MGEKCDPKNGCIVCSSDETISEIVGEEKFYSAIHNSGLSAEEIATTVRLPLPTVQTWLNRSNAPHEFMRKGVISAIYETARLSLTKGDPTITLAKNPDDLDSKDIYLRLFGFDGEKETITIVGLHAVGYAGPYPYTLVGLDGSRTEITRNFQAMETWGNEYDDEHNMLGRGSFRLHTHDIEGYAKDLEAEGWERYEGPKRRLP